MQHVGSTAEGNIFYADIIRKFQAGSSEVRLAFVINRGACSSHGEVLALNVRKAVDAGFIGYDNLVRVHIQAGDNLDVLISMALEAVSAVEALIYVGGNGDGNLCFAGRNKVQVLDAALRGLAGSLYAGNSFAPVVGDSCADSIEGTGGTGGREVDFYGLTGSRLSCALFVTAATAGDGACEHGECQCTNQQAFDGG